MRVSSESRPAPPASSVFAATLVSYLESNNKGINKQGGGLSAPALTDKDLEDIKFAASIEADYLAVSFVQTGDDCRRARDLLREAGGQGGIVAKVERAEALNHIDDIINASDVIMVARGDLGVEIGDAELPAAQKMLISRARQMNCVVITATQMMESMIENPIQPVLKFSTSLMRLSMVPMRLCYQQSRRQVSIRSKRLRR